MAKLHQSALLDRRTMLRGTGVAALGLAGAALLGCSGGGRGGGAGAGQPTVSVVGGSGLPLVAPVVRGNPRAGGVFVQPKTSTYVQNDTHTANAYNIWHVISEKGLEPNPVTAEIMPHVFTSWEIADPSALTLIFKMRPGIKIHNMPPWNGRVFDATDVAWSLERNAGLTADREKLPLAQFQRASMVANLVKAEAVDPVTVKVTLSKRNSAFFNGLTEARVMFMPKEMVDIGFKDPLKMGGIGPFQVSEWVPDSKMNFKKFPEYFRPNEPYFDAFNHTIIPDRSATVAAFATNQIQQIDTVLPFEIETIKKGKPDAALYTWVDATWNNLRLGMRYKPFQDFRVRKALFLSADYAAMNDGLYGPGWAYSGCLHPGFPEAWAPDKLKTLPGYNPATKEADRAEAAKLLTAAGYPNGKGLDFTITVGNPPHENAVRFQQQMPGIFPEMKIALHAVGDGTALNQVTTAGSFDMLPSLIRATPDAALELQSQYHSTGSRNYGKYTEPAIDSLLDRALLELDRNARTKMIQEFQQRWLDEWMPMLIVSANPQRTMIPANVGGFDKLAGPWFGYSNLSKVNRLFYVDK